MATLSDVAARAGLSPMTASRVLSGRGNVSPTAREAVLAAAAELGYVPNEVARSLRNARSNLVVLIVSDIENAFFSAIAKAAERAIGAAGYRLMISSSDEDGDQERELLQGVVQMRADALLITPTNHNRTMLEQMVASGLPVVQLDRAVPGLACPAVLLDNVAAGAEVVEHLFARGHRDVVMISGPQDLTTGAERADGARRAAAEHPEMRLTVVEAASFMHEASVDTVRLALGAEPTAIIAGNNIVLEACMDAFSRDGIAVPDDVALIGFDDLPWMSWVRPSLSAVRQPVEAITRAAVEVVLRALDPSSGPVDQTSVTRIDGQLVPRDSVPEREPSVR